MDIPPRGSVVTESHLPCPKIPFKLLLSSKIRPLLRLDRVVARHRRIRFEFAAIRRSGETYQGRYPDTFQLPMQRTLDCIYQRDGLILHNLQCSGVTRIPKHHLPILEVDCKLQFDGLVSKTCSRVPGCILHDEIGPRTPLQKCPKRESYDLRLPV